MDPTSWPPIVDKTPTGDVVRGEEMLDAVLQVVAASQSSHGKSDVRT